MFQSNHLVGYCKAWWKVFAEYILRFVAEQHSLLIYSVHWGHGLHCISLDNAIWGNDIQHAWFIQAPGNVSLYCICLDDVPFEEWCRYNSDITRVSWHSRLLTTQLFAQKLTSHKTAKFCNISSFEENCQWLVSSTSLSLCERIHWGPVDSHHKGTVMKYGLWVSTSSCYHVTNNFSMMTQFR